MTADIRQRIRHELRTSSGLKHANVLPVYGYSQGFGPLIAIVTPWAENGSLSSFLAHHGATLACLTRFHLLRDVACGLEYLHVNNIIHGDLTGPNILITRDGSARLSDFGLSRIGSADASWTSTLNGNLRWMAPELFGENNGLPVRPTKKSDIYSFGGVMYHKVITGLAPFHDIHDMAVIQKKSAGEKPSRTSYPQCCDRHWQFIDWCWSTEPGTRPTTDIVFRFIVSEVDYVRDSC
ncbi:kinase-like domain-containing protein [Suillus ampliporus]|nr:kinase-like domain-containing protein [Suillus ampliporus]